MLKVIVVALLLLGGCHHQNNTDTNVQAALKSGMSCWVEREIGVDQSGIYCGDASLAPVDSPRFVRWIKEQ